MARKGRKTMKQEAKKAPTFSFTQWATRTDNWYVWKKDKRFSIGKRMLGSMTTKQVMEFFKKNF